MRKNKQLKKKKYRVIFDAIRDNRGKGISAEDLMSTLDKEK